MTFIRSPALRAGTSSTPRRFHRDGWWRLPTITRRRWHTSRWGRKAVRWRGRLGCNVEWRCGAFGPFTRGGTSYIVVVPHCGIRRAGREQERKRQEEEQQEETRA